MSVASEINRIKSNIADAYDEAEAKGATMPATENSANLAQTVASIPTGSTPTLQSKTVTPTTSQQSITPDSGYDGLSDVKVEGVTSSIDTNITAGNIKKDVSILGVTGTYEGNTNANLDAYIQGDLSNIVFNGTQIIREIFNRNHYITSISMPNTEQIGVQSFYYCPNLVSVYWSNSLLIIYPQAFQGCSKLNITYFPPYLNNIGNGAFSNCTSIIAIDMSYLVNIPVIGNATFSNTTCNFLFRDQTQLDAYAAATNWSALADRFQIKGATP